MDRRRSQWTHSPWTKAVYDRLCAAPETAFTLGELFRPVMTEIPSVYGARKLAQFRRAGGRDEHATDHHGVWLIFTHRMRNIWIDYPKKSIMTRSTRIRLHLFEHCACGGLTVSDYPYHNSHPSALKNRKTPQTLTLRCLSCGAKTERLRQPGEAPLDFRPEAESSQKERPA